MSQSELIRTLRKRAVGAKGGNFVVVRDWLKNREQVRIVFIFQRRKIANAKPNQTLET